MQHRYCFHPDLILRTPARPATLPLTEGTLAASLHDDAFLEALYLASPVLHEECQKWRRNELTDPKRLARLRAAVTRYYSRFSHRCTPFGLFAGCTVVRWGAESRITLTPARHARHTRLDMHYLCALAQALAAHACIRPRLRYWPNSSWYELGGEVRYIEQHYVQTQRVHQISALGASELVGRALAACAHGLPYPALVAQLAGEGEQADATAFVEALIDTQVLVSELEPTVTGPEFLVHLQQVLARLQAEHAQPLVGEIARVLAEVAELLAALDQQPVNPASHYQRIMALLQPLGVELEADKLFQTDSIPGVCPQAATLDHGLQAELLDALDALACLGGPARPTRLAEFKRQFQLRYEEREVPLLEALDTESGIAYGASHGGYSPLVHDLEFAESTRPAAAPPADEAHQFMYQKLREAERSGAYSVALSPAELRRLRRPAAPLPPSLGVLFRPVAGGQLLLDGAGGSSAVNLLGRFAHAAPRIGQLVREVTQAEQQHNPAVAFAELCHLPSSRVGNILLRPSFRDLEIPYLAQSGLPAAGQVRVQDLTLALRQGELELRSRRTGQRIVPRLSTAHNYAAQALPVYELLCDLQTQGLTAQLGFSWQALSLPRPFFPRLTYQRVILAEASWQLERDDFAALLAAAPAEVPAEMAAFRARWRLPGCFTLVDGDNELLVDADNPLLVHAWLDSIRGRPAIKLKEYLADPAASPVRDGAGQAYAAQFVALLVRQTPCYAAAPAAGAGAAATAGAAVRRAFELGSEWLYYKLYCGPKVANRLLRDTIGPLTERLRGAGLLDYWFFVRYADPDPHLRLRLHLPNPAAIGEVVRLVSEYLAPALQNGAVWKSQTDTYQRELERYSPHAIDLTERLFHYQSVAVLAHLDELTGGEDDEAYWLWGVRALDELLEAFGCPLPQKLALLRHLQQAFADEFGVDKNLKRQLDAKYRLARTAIDEALPAVPPAVPAALLPLAAAIRAALADQPSSPTLVSLLGSYAHMLLNRLFPSDARLHELVLYDFLARHYQSRLARHGPAEPPPAGPGPPASPALPPV